MVTLDFPHITVDALPVRDIFGSDAEAEERHLDHRAARAARAVAVCELHGQVGHVRSTIRVCQPIAGFRIATEK